LIALNDAHHLALGFITNILSKAISEAKLVQAFHRIIGAIPFLEEPCSPRTLEGLLNLESGEVTRVLSKLHSLAVIPISDDDPIEPLHPSFLEYLMNSELCGHPDFVIHPVVRQIDLALACFSCMERGTQVYSWPSITSDIKISDGLPDIPPDLRYACLHWVSHLSWSPPGEPILVAALDVLLSQYFHYWLTTLSLAGDVKKVLSSLQRARTWIPVSTFLVSCH